ncbi:hypothetical protein HDV06_004642 [Boothiomyces sp. JEL0866]|nr:hypothetical protein HDV06_004642 [Boothiomyces sp. JEL0866]
MSKPVVEKQLSDESIKLAEKTPPVTPPEWKNLQEIVLHSVKGATRSFFISFLLRGGVSFIIRLIAVYRRKTTIFSALKASMGYETQRFAKMIASFSLTWKLISNFLYFKTKKNLKRNGALAGAIAGLSVLIESPENRVAIAQQFSMRALQGAKNALKQRKLFSMPHGDTLLFSLAVASIMYAYTMHPDTIPREYYSWIVQHGRVPKVIVELNRENTKGHQAGYFPANIEALKAAMIKTHATPENTKKLFDYIKANNGIAPNLPCSAIHARENSCVKYQAGVWYKTFLEMSPVYFSLNAVPTLLFKFKSVVERIIKSTAISSSFISTYVYMFQTGLCLHRTFFPQQKEKYLFYYLGIVTGLSILIEQKPKRAELAMYVLPKGLQSLYTLMIQNGTLIPIPHLDVIATCGAMSTIMSLYQTEPHQLSSLMYKVMKGVIGTF